VKLPLPTRLLTVVLYYLDHEKLIIFQAKRQNGNKKVKIDKFE
jgi:hypothetical protein